MERQEGTCLYSFLVALKKTQKNTQVVRSYVLKYYKKLNLSWEGGRGLRLAQLKKHTFFLILSILINLSKILWNPPEIIMLYLNPSFSIRTLKTFRLLDRVNKNRRKKYWYKGVLWVYKGSRKKGIFLMARTLRGVGGRAGYKEEINFPRKNNKISKIFKTRKKSARKKRKTWLQIGTISN